MLQENANQYFTMKTNNTHVTLNLIQGDNVICHPEGDNPKELSTLESRFFAFAQNDERNKILKQSWWIIGGSAGSTQPSTGLASLLPKSAVQDDVVINKNVKILVP